MDDKNGLTLTLELIEKRRMAYDQSMWQAPTLTIAGQAFLLVVLTDPDVTKPLLRVFLLAAGVAAAFAALAALLRLRAREVLYSEAVGQYCKMLGIDDPRPSALQDRFGSQLDGTGMAEKRIRQLAAGPLFKHVYLFWAAALVLFIAADALAFALIR